jgi:phosphatidylglycerophosphate synthase
VTGSGAPAAERPVSSRAADALTLSRALLAVVIGWLAWRGLLDAAAVALGIAWLTDAFDGRVARLTGARTRLGDWDMAVDVLVGACLLAGLGLSGLVPRLLAIAVLAVVGTLYVVLRQAALGMVVQATAYGSFLWLLWARGVSTLWAPVGVIVLIAALDGRKLVRVILPEFFRGIAGAARLRRGTRLGLPPDED